MRFVGQIPAAAREEGRMWHCGPRREALGARRRPRGGPGSLPGQVATCRPVGAAGCPPWAALQNKHPRPARLNHTLPGNTRDPESHGLYPHHCFPTQPVPFRFPLRPPPTHTAAQATASLEETVSPGAPPTAGGQALAQGATASAHGPWKREGRDCAGRGVSRPGGTGCLGPAVAGAPGRPHTHASAEGKLEAENTTWPA